MQYKYKNNNNKLRKLTSIVVLLFAVFLPSKIAIGKKHTAADSIQKSTYKTNNKALLPKNRIVAYYGNFRAKRSGVIGEYPRDQMVNMLLEEVEKWELADPNTPVIPAFDYVTVMAQNAPTSNGKYIYREPSAQLLELISLAEEINGLVFLDIQPGLSTLKEEIPLLDQYLKDPRVHLALDPEFAMKNGKIPGKTIGTMDAKEINYAVKYLGNLVRKYNLPPKILVIHRFTKPMLTNHQDILIIPEVQVVIEMDGWGKPNNKKKTYKIVIQDEPVQFTGFKVFYHNDTWNNGRIMQPNEILKLKPKPLFILYQ